MRYLARSSQAPSSILRAGGSSLSSAVLLWQDFAQEEKGRFQSFKGQSDAERSNEYAVGRKIIRATYAGSGRKSDISGERVRGVDQPRAKCYR